MSLLRSIDRLVRIDAMLRREGTGPSEEFAKKLGISRSMLMENLREMKELGAEICFCQHRRTYFYTNNFTLIIGNISQANVKGGGGNSFLVRNENFSFSPVTLDTGRISWSCQFGDRDIQSGHITRVVL